MTDRNDMLLAMALRAVAHERCLLCKKRKTHFYGVFLPYNSVRYGGRPDKTRALTYRLCKRCERLPDRNERVERSLEQQFAYLWN